MRPELEEPNTAIYSKNEGPVDGESDYGVGIGAGNGCQAGVAVQSPVIEKSTCGGGCRAGVSIYLGTDVIPAGQSRLDGNCVGYRFHCIPEQIVGLHNSVSEHGVLQFHSMPSHIHR
jgi:hypothetical protein